MGVTVQAKGTTKAVATDLDGNYTISVPDKNAVLVFSYVGYQKQEVKVGDKTVVNVVLQGDASCWTRWSLWVTAVSRKAM